MSSYSVRASGVHRNVPPCPTLDGCDLYFTSNRNSDGVDDAYVVRRSR